MGEMKFRLQDVFSSPVCLIKQPEFLSDLSVCAVLLFFSGTRQHPTSEDNLLRESWTGPGSPDQFGSFGQRRRQPLGKTTGCGNRRPHESTALVDWIRIRLDEILWMRCRLD